VPQNAAERVNVHSGRQTALGEIIAQCMRGDALFDLPAEHTAGSLPRLPVLAVAHVQRDHAVDFHF